MTIEKESISEPELIKRWNTNPYTFFFRKQNHRTPKYFLENMTARYYMDDVIAYEVANGITVASR